jgi:predicted PurR-regulated permease PerM
MNTTRDKPRQQEVRDSSSTPANRRTLQRAARAARRREAGILLGRIARLWLAFIRGQVILMLVVGVITWLGLIALGVPHALALGAAAGLLEIVPNLGPVISTALGAVVALQYGSSYLPISNPLLAVLVILFYVLVQQVENIFIVPRVMGDALKLPALVVLAGITAGAAVGGVPGALLATPVIATARELWRFYRHKRRGEEPFPVEKVAP